MDRITTPFGFSSTAAEVAAGVNLPESAPSSPAARQGSASKRLEPWPRPAPRSRSQSAIPKLATAPPRTLPLPPATSASASVSSIWSIAHRSPVSSANGSARCTFWSTTPAASCRRWSGQRKAGRTVRPEPPGTLRARGRSARSAGRRGRSADRFGQLGGSPLLPVIFDDIHFAYRPYDPLLAYGQSKTANVLFAVGATGDGQRTASRRTWRCQVRS